MWCIWYTDGATFSSDDGDPQDAPGAGVVVIAQDGGNHDDPYVKSGQGFGVVEGRDWYLYDRGHWFSSDMAGLVQYVAEPGYKIVKAGRWVPPDVFDTFRDEASRWGFDTPQEEVQEEEVQEEEVQEEEV